ncbi:MAG: endonuclease III [Dysgonamonadaceae bacterium]|jgi:endonuclease-3|nr:endonuclease III [Dysgonamonadaceae bacterium]
MTQKQRYNNVLAWFGENMPTARSELHYHNPYELIVAVILSAQCTDKRVNMITPAFFEMFPDVETLAASNKDAVFELIKSVSYPNSKAAHLAGMAQTVVARFGGQIPKTVEDLMTLPGVGRKTANVIASVAFDIPALAVDTHVFRVANRIGLTENSRSPEETERELTRHIPKKLWSIAHHWLILHGRYICTARKPRCEDCGLKNFCNFYLGFLKKTEFS